MKGNSRTIVAYSILGCAASFFSRLCIHSKTREKKKRNKKNYCVYFTGVFVNRLKKKEIKRKQQREENKYNQLLDTFSQSVFLFHYSNLAGNDMQKVIECVPNFSEGQRKEVIKRIALKFSQLISILRLLIPLHMLLQVLKVWLYWILIQVYQQIEQYIVQLIKK